MSEMQATESMERLVEGLKRAAACARQMAKSQKNFHWNNAAHTLDELSLRAQELARSKPLSRAVTLAMIDRLVEKNAIHPGSQGKQ